jgi:hypothetical protein
MGRSMEIGDRGVRADINKGGEKKGQGCHGAGCLLAN